MGYDRDDVLTRTDLGQLCDELLGPHKGRGRGATWPCPDPHHGPQTGQTPPVSVFRPRSGTERWHCHGCGAGGTAIDLVMRAEGVGFPEAIELLGRRTGAAEAPAWMPKPPRARAEPPAPPPGDPPPALEHYVSACEDWLWGPNGTAMRRYLATRGLGVDVLRANRVGADPGPRALPREPGLPRGGAAVVFPLFNEQSRVAYLQARYLSPNGRKYDNPSASLVPVSPRLGEVRLPCPTRADNVVLVCEGLPDALTVAQTGLRAVAVLGAGLPDERLARTLAERYPDEHLVIAFDADHRGRAGTERLAGLLRAAGVERMAELPVAEDFGDLNAWAQTVGDERFGEDLARALTEIKPSLAMTLMETTAHAHHPVSTLEGEPMTNTVETDDEPGRAADEGPLDELLETLAYRHLLLDDREAVARNVETVKEALMGWRKGRDRPGSMSPEKGPEGIGDLLDRIGHDHVLLDDKDAVATNLDRVAAMVDRCSERPAFEAPTTSRTTDDLEVLLAGISSFGAWTVPGLRSSRTPFLSTPTRIDE